VSEKNTMKVFIKGGYYMKKLEKAIIEFYTDMFNTLFGHIKYEEE